ncbi:hypothetical protein [Isoptericola sp. BMS4]|uniref:hypothetical protein n=1 Tax=Isoptericola sp. BMS4 TaxID=2527875 RepID=UPI0014232D51|nr:hypothetical protein [Isoptericola sp. BMS4]
MPNARIQIGGRTLARGEHISDLEVAHVDLAQCWCADGPPDDMRPTLSNIRVKDVRLNRTTLGGAVVRDVTVDGVRGDSASKFMFGNQFERVAVKGRVGVLVLNIKHSQPEYVDEYAPVLKAAEAATDWTLDISEAVGSVEIRGYSADKIRRNPETQVVVRRENLADGRWRDIDLETTAFGISMEHVFTYGWQDTILVADPTRKAKYPAELRVIQRLRDEGIADLA